MAQVVSTEVLAGSPWRASWFDGYMAIELLAGLGAAASLAWELFL